MELHPADKMSTVKRIAHRLPCNVELDGPAPTARAFCAFPNPIPSFRGRKLQAGDLKIPDSSQLIFVERQDTDNQIDSSNISFSVKYVLERDGFFYQHDDFPDTNSAVPRALDWLSVASALHDPVSIPEDETTEKPNDKTHAQ